MANKYFIGLDLSLLGSGVVVIDSNEKLIEKHLVTSSTTPPTVECRFARFMHIVEEISRILQYLTVKPLLSKGAYEMCAIESYSFASQGAKKSQLIESGALVRQFLYKNSVSMVEVAPQQLKKFLLGTVTNKGKEAKNIMCRELYIKYGVKIDNDNEVDAYILALIARRYYYYRLSQSSARQAKLEKLPKYQREILEKLLSKHQGEEFNKLLSKLHAKK